MESLSCGLPIVATRVGGIPDIVSHGTTGLLVEKGDIQGLADALIALLRDPSTCIRMGKEATRLPILISIFERPRTDSLISIEKPLTFIQALSAHKRSTRIARQP